MSSSAQPPLPTRPTPEPRRYGAWSIALHWIVAALIATQLGLGWYMNEVLPDHSPQQDRVQDIHIEIGLTLLLVVLVRIVARFLKPAPPMSDALPGWERRLAQTVHYLLYALMLIIPLSGWALLTVRHYPPPFWGLQWPSMPGVLGLAGDRARAWSGALKGVHIFWLIWALVIALALHLAGAIKHQFDGRPVLWRMIPFLKRPPGA